MGQMEGSECNLHLLWGVCVLYSMQWFLLYNCWGFRDCLKMFAHSGNIWMYLGNILVGGGVIGVTRYLVVLATLNVMVEGWWLPTDSFLFLPPLFIILWGHACL